MRVSRKKNIVLGFTAMLLFWASVILADENASNPLAAVNNTDARAKYLDLNHGNRKNDYIDGATMLNPKLKLKYELHYWDTNVTGSNESDWESARAKLIYFAKEGKLKGDRPYRLAAGGKWIKDLGDSVYSHFPTRQGLV